MSTTHTEDLTDQVDGFVAAFTTEVIFVTGSLVVVLNGMRLRPGVAHDYVETSSQGFTMALVPEFGEHLLVQYETEATATGFPLVIGYPSDPGF